MLKYRKVDKGHYDVLFGDVRLGSVYHDPEAWSYRPWFIEGVKQQMCAGGVNGFTVKASGFGTRRQAARHLAVMQSSEVLR